MFITASIFFSHLPSTIDMDDTFLFFPPSSFPSLSSSYEAVKCPWTWKSKIGRDAWPHYPEKLLLCSAFTRSAICSQVLSTELAPARARHLGMVDSNLQLTRTLFRHRAPQKSIMPPISHKRLPAQISASYRSGCVQDSESALHFTNNALSSILKFSLRRGARVAGIDNCVI